MGAGDTSRSRLYGFDPQNLTFARRIGRPAGYGQDDLRTGLTGRDLHYKPGAIATSTRYTALNVPPARLRQSVTLSQLALAPVRATVSGADLAPRMFCPACTL